MKRPTLFRSATPMMVCELHFARARARDLVGRIGFDGAPLRARLRDHLAFDAVSAHPPTDIQLAAAEAPGPVVVIEAETGSGKTEAALWRFASLFAAGKVDGLYFALPTRVAASQMHTRVQTSVRTLVSRRRTGSRACAAGRCDGGVGYRPRSSRFRCAVER